MNNIAPGADAILALTLSAAALAATLWATTAANGRRDLHALELGVAGLTPAGACPTCRPIVDPAYRENHAWKPSSEPPVAR